MDETTEMTMKALASQPRMTDETRAALIREMDVVFADTRSSSQRVGDYEVLLLRARHALAASQEREQQELSRTKLIAQSAWNVGLKTAATAHEEHIEQLEADRGHAVKRQGEMEIEVYDLQVALAASQERERQAFDWGWDGGADEGNSTREAAWRAYLARAEATHRNPPPPTTDVGGVVKKGI